MKFSLAFLATVAALKMPKLPKEMSKKSSEDKNFLSFSVVGDWGGFSYRPYQSPWGYRVARSMNRVAKKYETDFLMLIGDNFYFDGVENLEDIRFQRTFEDTFEKGKLSNLDEMPIYVQSGNHDYRGNMSAQLLYSNYNNQNRWKFPDLWYKIPLPNLKNIDGSEITAEIYMIDTNALRSQPSKDFKDKEAIEKRRFDHYRWLDNELSNSKADFIIVAGHHPIYSIAEHGPTNELVADLLPILKANKVNFYISGHDHQLQLLTDINSDLQFIVSGAATLPNPSRKHRNDLPDNIISQMFWSETGLRGYGGYTHFMVYDNKIRAYFIDAKNDEVIFSTSSGRRGVYGGEEPGCYVCG